MKSIIVNKVNGKNHQISVPCSATHAETFATTCLDGEYQIYSYDTESGTDAETDYNDMQIMVKNSTTKEKTYLNLKIKSNKTEEDVFNALLGLTVDNIVVDEAFIISSKKVVL